MKLNVRRGSVICLLLALTACASPAPRGQMSTEQLAVGDTQQTYARATDAERNRVYCRREYQVGSNRPVRICMTLAQRQRIQEEAAGQVDNLNRRTTMCGETSSCGGIQ